jgi:hypothetical protein
MVVQESMIEIIIKNIMQNAYAAPLKRGGFKDTDSNSSMSEAEFHRRLIMESSGAGGYSSLASGMNVEPGEHSQLSFKGSHRLTPTKTYLQKKPSPPTEKATPPSSNTNSLPHHHNSPQTAIVEHIISQSVPVHKPASGSRDNTPPFNKSASGQKSYILERKNDFGSVGSILDRFGPNKTTVKIPGGPEYKVEEIAATPERDRVAYKVSTPMSFSAEKSQPIPYPQHTPYHTREASKSPPSIAKAQPTPTQPKEELITPSKPKVPEPVTQTTPIKTTPSHQNTAALESLLDKFNQSKAEDSLEYKLDSKRVDEADYFSFSPSAPTIGPAPPFKMEVRNSDQIQPSNFTTSITGPTVRSAEIEKALMALEISRLQLVIGEKENENKMLHKTIKDLEVISHRLDLDIQSLKTVPSQAEEIEHLAKELQTKSVLVKILEDKVRILERSLQDAKDAQSTQNQDRPSNWQSGSSSQVINDAFPDMMSSFFKELQTILSKKSDDYSSVLCGQIQKQFILMKQPLQDKSLSIKNIDVLLKGLLTSLGQDKTKRSISPSEASDSSKSISALKGSQIHTPPRSVSPSPLQDRVEVVDGKQVKVRFLPKHGEEEKIRTPSPKATPLPKEIKYTPDSPTLSLTERLVEENTRMAEEYVKIKAQNKSLKQRIDELIAKHTT